MQLFAIQNTGNRVAIHPKNTEVRKLKIEDLHFEMPNESINEKDFDLEKWRRESPMNYLKAMYLLSLTNNSTVKTEIFMTIHRITRLYIPDVLYKYSSLSNDNELNEKKFQTLQKGQIFMSDIKDFNDPFDGKGFFYDPSQLANIERLKPYGGKWIDDFNAYIKATSLTGNGVSSMPMWAHYSNNHAGFCVSYDMKANPTLHGCTFPVQYTNERVDVTSLMKSQAQATCDEIERQISLGKTKIILNDLSIVYMALLLCNLKHTSWSYEKEFRCTTGAIAEGMPYIKAKPKEIYIGMNCSQEHTARLIGIANSLRIPVHKMTFDECNPFFDLSAKDCIGQVDTNR